MKIESKVFFIGFVLLVLMFVSLRVEATTIGTIEIRVTDTPSVMETTPTLGADDVSRIVVYTSQMYDPVNDVYEDGVIYAQRLNESVVIPPLILVASGGTDNQLNDISGSLVVYTDFTDSTSLQGQIQLINLDDGHTPYVLSDRAMVREARIHGDLVVWIEFFMGTPRVMLKNVNTGAAPKLISDATTQPASNLQIGDTFVVWEVKVGDHYDVVAYDLRTTTGQNIWVANNTALSEHSPSTSGTWVTWEECVTGSTVSRIRAVDVDNSDAAIFVTNDGGNNRLPTIDGDFIAYEALVDDVVNDPNYDIFVYRISTGETFAITTEAGDQIQSNIFGNQVAYVDNSTGTSDIQVTTFLFDSCNLPPEITSIAGPLNPVALGTTYEMTGTFTDPDDGDTHTATWDWGDGTTSPGTIDQLDDTVVTGSQDYDTPGVYTITLTVVDSSGESDTATWSQFSVIYDSSAGFATGGGWINSPAGAYPAEPDLSGKANFGFVSKYRKGATVPTGNTGFQFHVGDLNFHSDTYEWLVITDAQAKFKGIGTINGEGSYKFMLTAVDGTLSSEDGADKFRIKIWLENEEIGEEEIVYDNLLLEISGGSIKVHKG